VTIPSHVVFGFSNLPTVQPYQASCCAIPANAASGKISTNKQSSRTTNPNPSPEQYMDWPVGMAVEKTEDSFQKLESTAKVDLLEREAAADKAKFEHPFKSQRKDSNEALPQSS
jgi:hypothetical protein